MDQRIRARTIRKAKVSRGDGVAECSGMLPREGFGDQPAKAIPRTNPADPPVWLAQSSELAQSHRTHDNCGDVSIGQELCCVRQGVEIGIVLQAELEVRVTYTIEARAVFRVLDTDGSGTLSIPELATNLEAAARTHPHSSQMTLDAPRDAHHMILDDR